MKFDLGYNGKLVIMQEDSRNAYGLQAADLIANISYRYATNGSDAEMFMYLARRALAVRFPSRAFGVV